MKLIGLGYRKRSGKDTVGQYLVEHHGYKQIAFADPLKQAAMAMCGFTYEQCYGEDKDKETIDPRWGFSPRWFMQTLGTEVGRSISTDLWVKRAMHIIQRGENDRIVITDVRFPNEADAIKALGGVVINVERPSLGPLPLPRGLAERLTDKLLRRKPRTAAHPSELSMADYEFDDTVFNSSTLAALYDRVDSLLERLSEERPEFR